MRRDHLGRFTTRAGVWRSRLRNVPWRAVGAAAAGAIGGYGIYRKRRATSAPASSRRRGAKRSRVRKSGRARSSRRRIGGCPLRNKFTKVVRQPFPRQRKFVSQPWAKSHTVNLDWQGPSFDTTPGVSHPRVNNTFATVWEPLQLNTIAKPCTLPFVANDSIPATYPASQMGVDYGDWAHAVTQLGSSVSRPVGDFDLYRRFYNANEIHYCNMTMRVRNLHQYNGLKIWVRPVLKSGTVVDPDQVIYTPIVGEEWRALEQPQPETLADVKPTVNTQGIGSRPIYIKSTNLTEDTFDYNEPTCPPSDPTSLPTSIPDTSANIIKNKAVLNRGKFTIIKRRFNIRRLLAAGKVDLKDNIASNDIQAAPHVVGMPEHAVVLQVIMKGVPPSQANNPDTEWLANEGHINGYISASKGAAIMADISFCCSFSGIWFNRDDNAISHALQTNWQGDDWIGPPPERTTPAATSGFTAKLNPTNPVDVMET